MWNNEYILINSLRLTRYPTLFTVLTGGHLPWDTRTAKLGKCTGPWTPFLMCRAEKDNDQSIEISVILVQHVFIEIYLINLCRDKVDVSLLLL